MRGAGLAKVVEPDANVLEQEIDDRRGVEGEGLRDDEAADDGDAEGLAQFGAGAHADGQRTAPNSAAIVVIMIGRKRMMQAL